MATKRAWQGIFALLAAVGGTAPLPAQQELPARPAAEQKRGSPEPPTHDPRPAPDPAVFLRHVREGNRAAVAARAAKSTPPPPRVRPAGAGRYVCAVLVCADADLDVPALLGLDRRDVLVIATPGPRVDRESVALLEHLATSERLPLVLVLTHADCLAATLKPGRTPQQPALAERLEATRRAARPEDPAMPRALARSNRELLLAASSALRERCEENRLRVVPAEVDTHTLALRWHTHAAEELPLPVVK